MQKFSNYDIIIKQEKARIVFYDNVILILTKISVKKATKKIINAEVVKLADAPDSKSGGLILRAGSTPAFGTRQK